MTEISDEQRLNAHLLLDRELPEGYREEWTEILSKEKLEPSTGERISVVIFRLEKEWFALPTDIFKEIARVKRVHFLPFRRSPVIAGLVNVRGRLQMCINLKLLLSIDEREQHECASTIYRRMVILEPDERIWAFEADEVHGIFHVDKRDLENVPVTVSKSVANYLAGVFKWTEGRVGFLDRDLVFSSLIRSVS